MRTAGVRAFVCATQHWNSGNYTAFSSHTLQHYVTAFFVLLKQFSAWDLLPHLYMGVTIENELNLIKINTPFCPITIPPPQWEGFSRDRRTLIATPKTVSYTHLCNGTTELATVECYDSAEMKWKRVTSLPLARSNTGKSFIYSKSSYYLRKWMCNIR